MFFLSKISLYLSKTSDVTFGRKPVFSTKPISIFEFKLSIFFIKPKLGLGENAEVCETGLGSNFISPILDKKYRPRTKSGIYPKLGKPVFEVNYKYIKCSNLRKHTI